MDIIWAYSLPVSSANEAHILHVIFHDSCLISETSECVDDDTEYNVEEEQNDNHHER